MNPRRPTPAGLSLRAGGLEPAPFDLARAPPHLPVLRFLRPRFLADILLDQASRKEALEYDWWARGDLNPRPPGYQPGALTRLSYGPIPSYGGWRGVISLIFRPLSATMVLHRCCSARPSFASGSAELWRSNVVPSFKTLKKVATSVIWCGAGGGI